MVKLSAMLKVIIRAFAISKVLQEYAGTSKKLTPRVGHTLFPNKLGLPTLNGIT